jgi:hypothetical protein
MYTYPRRFVQCYRTHYVITVLILWSWQRCCLSSCIHNIYTEYMHNTALHTYINMYVYAPALEVTVPTVFMVWLSGWNSPVLQRWWNWMYLHKWSYFMQYSITIKWNSCHFTFHLNSAKVCICIPGSYAEFMHQVLLCKTWLITHSIPHGSICDPLWIKWMWRKNEWMTLLWYCSLDYEQ